MFWQHSGHKHLESLLCVQESSSNAVVPALVVELGDELPYDRSASVSFSISVLPCWEAMIRSRLQRFTQILGMAGGPCQSDISSVGLLGTTARGIPNAPTRSGRCIASNLLTFHAGFSAVTSPPPVRCAVRPFTQIFIQAPHMDQSSRHFLTISQHLEPPS